MKKAYTLEELQSLLANLDNHIPDRAIFEKEQDMAAKEQRRVIIGWNDDGTPIRKHLICTSQDEMNDRIVKAYVESGRIFEFMDRVKAECEESATGILLRDYASKWLNRKRKLKPTTKANYEKYLKHINDSLGDKRVDDISIEDVQGLLDDRSYLSHKTLKDMKGVLHQIFKYAVNDGIVTKNPCESLDIEIPSNRAEQREALPIDQFRDILLGLGKLQTMERRYLALIMYTGMRRGEALGLRWEDINFNKNTIHICRNVTHPQQNMPVIGTPKTKAGCRTIPMDTNLVELLRPHLTEGYVIGGENPLTLSGFRSMMERIHKTIDLHGATAHILRHSYLTYAVGETTDFKTIQGISGHADISTLVNRYAHPQEDKISVLMEKIHARLAL